MRKINYRDVIIRALKTFMQAFISAFGIDAIFGVTDARMLKKALLAVLISAVAAGISAVWNMLLEFVNKKIDEIDITDEGSDEDADES